MQTNKIPAQLLFIEEFYISIQSIMTNWLEKSQFQAVLFAILFLHNKYSSSIRWHVCVFSWNVVRLLLINGICGVLWLWWGQRVQGSVGLEAQ